MSKPRQPKQCVLNGQDIRHIRECLRISQTEMGQLLGLHYVTICCWETGSRAPRPYEEALLLVFRRAGHVPKLRETIILDGPIRALYEVLHKVYGHNLPESILKRD